jgi:hypothetical protein
MSAGGALACLRIGWAARFVAFDGGSTNNPKSGEVWCHYSIPTPEVRSTSQRPFIRQVKGNWESSDTPRLFIAAVHVWDGNRRILADNNVGTGPFNGGISGVTTNVGASVDENLVYKREVNVAINFGVGVSLLVRAREARDDFLEIRGVALEYKI